MDGWVYKASDFYKITVCTLSPTNTEIKHNYKFTLTATPYSFICLNVSKPSSKSEKGHMKCVDKPQKLQKIRTQTDDVIKRATMKKMWRHTGNMPFLLVSCINLKLRCPH